MPSGLTPKQEAFCRAYLKTGNASEAYREAYDCKGSNPATVNRQAKALLDNPKIAARLQASRDKANERAEITLAAHLKSLGELRDSASADGQYSAAVSAEVARGKASGLHVERVEHSLEETLEQLVLGSLKK